MSSLPSPSGDFSSAQSGERLYDESWALEESTVIYNGPEGIIAIPREMRAARRFGMRLCAQPGTHTAEGEQDDREWFEAQSAKGPIVFYIPAGTSERFFVHFGVLYQADENNDEVKKREIPPSVLALFKAASGALSRGHFAYFRAFADFGRNLQEESGVDTCPVVNVDAITKGCPIPDWIPILQEIGRDPCGSNGIDFAMNHPRAAELTANGDFMRLAIQIQPFVFQRDSGSPLNADTDFILEAMQMLKSRGSAQDAIETVLCGVDPKLYRNLDFMLRAIAIEPASLTYADAVLFSDTRFDKAVFERVEHMDEAGQLAVFSQLHRFAFTLGVHAPLTMDLAEIRQIMRAGAAPAWVKAEWHKGPQGTD